MLFLYPFGVITQVFVFLFIDALKTVIVSILAALADKKRDKKNVIKIIFFIDLWFLLVQISSIFDRNLLNLNSFAAKEQRHGENYLAFSKI